MQSELRKAKEMLKNNGYKLTPQRRATLEVIVQNEGKHMSSEEIYMEVKKECPEIGLATIYRTIQLLEDMDIIYKHNFNDGRNRYELNHFDEDHQHHHLVCIKCGSVIEVEEDLLELLEQRIESAHHFKVLDHRLKFLGYCIKCQIS